MAPQFTDAEVAILTLIVLAYYSLLVIPPSIVVAHLLGWLGLPRVRLATPLLVAAVAGVFEHRAPVFYVFPCIATLLLLAWGRPRLLFGSYVSRAPGGGDGADASEGSARGAPTPVQRAAAFASAIAARPAVQAAAARMKPAGPVAFWVVVLAAHYAYAFAVLKLSTKRGEDGSVLLTGLAGLLVLLAVAVALAIWSAGHARALGWRAAPAFLGSGLTFLGASIAGLLLLAPATYVVLLGLVSQAGHRSEVGGIAALVGAPLFAAPAAWVVALALAPVGAERAYGGTPGGRAAISQGRRWAAAGSVVAHAFAWLNPPAGLLVIPVIVSALAGAGYLRAVARGGLPVQV